MTLQEQHQRTAPAVESRAPDRAALLRYAAEGLTQQQMAERWTKESPYRTTRSAVAMALKREEIPPVRPRPRYEEEIPWRVAERHQRRTDAQMLRLWARRKHGKQVVGDEALRLNRWLGRLEEQDAVIVYVSDTEEGFFWIARDRTGDLDAKRWIWVDPRAN